MKPRFIEIEGLEMAYSVINTKEPKEDALFIFEFPVDPTETDVEEKYKKFYEWLREIYDFSDKNEIKPKKKVEMKVFNDQEEWILREAWPISISFGDMGGPWTIELTIEFESMEYKINDA